MARLLAFTDPHFTKDNVHITELFCQEFLEKVREENPDAILCLGDVLDTNKRVDVPTMNRVQYFIEKCSTLTPVYIIVGNHDMCNSYQFLSKDHWMNALKKWKNVHIVDKVSQFIINGKKITMCAYVFPGRFTEALDEIEDWKSSDLVCAHQEIQGCKFGPKIMKGEDLVELKSDKGDVYEKEWPLLISGHIHVKQWIGDNVCYIGSCTPGRNNAPYIALINIGDKIEVKSIRMKSMPIKKTIHLLGDEAKQFKTPDGAQDLKLIITMKDDSEIKAFKRTQKYKELEKQNKIVIKKQMPKMITQCISFENVLMKLINEKGNSHLEELMKRYFF